MAANGFGNLFKIHSFGESHGAALGVVIEGCSAGLHFDLAELKRQMDRRRPGQTQVVSARNESDEFEILSGVFEEKTLGTPIAIIVRNRDQKSEDYAKPLNRTGHADDVWASKFGFADHRGGGRSSGRETLSRVLGGAVAQMLVRKLSPETKCLAFVEQIGEIAIDAEDKKNIQLALRDEYDLEKSAVRMPSLEKSQQLHELLLQAKEKGESYGGIIGAVIHRAPTNLGQPVFKKLKSELSAALMSIGAVNGIEFGSGFGKVEVKGTEFHRQFHRGSQSGGNENENYGGIRGGISTGEDIYLRLVFKPTSSILDVAKKGRHDPCILPRAVVVVEAMINLVLADQLLWRRLDQISLDQV